MAETEETGFATELLADMRKSLKISDEEWKEAFSGLTPTQQYKAMKVIKARNARQDASKKGSSTPKTPIIGPSPGASGISPGKVDPKSGKVTWNIPLSKIGGSG